MWCFLSRSLLPYSGRNWKMQTVYFVGAPCVAAGCQRKFCWGPRLTFWVNQMCRSPGGAAVQFSALSGENWAVASCPLHLSVGFMVSLKVAGSARFRHWKKHLLNLGALFHFPSSEGLGKALSQLVLSDISVQSVTRIQWEWVWHCILHFCSCMEKCFGFCTSGPLPLGLCVGVLGLATCENHLFVPEIMVKTWTMMGLNFPSDKWHLEERDTEVLIVLFTP